MTGDGGKVSVSLHGVRNRFWSIEVLGIVVGCTETGPGVKAGVSRLLYAYCGFSCLIFGGIGCGGSGAVVGGDSGGEDSDFAPSSFLPLGSFFDLVTRGLGGPVRFRLVGSRPNMAVRNREYLIRAAWPLVISWARIGS